MSDTQRFLTKQDTETGCDCNCDIHLSFLDKSDFTTKMGYSESNQQETEGLLQNEENADSAQDVELQSKIPRVTLHSVY